MFRYLSLSSYSRFGLMLLSLVGYGVILIAAALLWKSGGTVGCGCFEEGGPVSCLLRDAGGSAPRLAAKFILPLLYCGLCFAFLRVSKPRRIVLMMLVVAAASVLVNNLGLPHGICAYIE